MKAGTQLGLILATLLVVARAGTLFELKLLKFDNFEGKVATGHCCETYGTGTCRKGLLNLRKCDHEFTVCIDEPTTDYPKESIDHCRYAKSSSKPMKGNSLTFADDVRGLRNPIKLQFTVWPGSVRVKVKVGDRDLLSKSDLVDLFVRDHIFKPDGQVRQFALLGQGKIMTRLQYEIVARCEPNYYGDKCIQYCIPRDDDTGHYKCDPKTGYKLCLQGYKDNTTNCVTPHSVKTSTLSPTMPSIKVVTIKLSSSTIIKAVTNKHVETTSKPAMTSQPEAGSSTVLTTTDHTTESATRPTEQLTKAEALKTSVSTEVATTTSPSPEALTTMKSSACKNNPCLNGSTCKESEFAMTGYSCVCALGYFGQHCEIAQ